MSKIGDIYKKALKYTFYDIRFYLLGVVGFFIAIIILSALFFRSNTDYMWQIINEFRKSIENMSDISSVQAVQLFMNNTKVAGLCILLGFVPFLFLPALVLASNAAIMGAVAAMYASMGQSVTRMIIFGIMPHGFFELMALFISMAIGIHLCLTVTQRITERRITQGTVIPVIKNAALSFITICVPLLIIAAIIEAFVTGHLIEWFVI